MLRRQFLKYLGLPIVAGIGATGAWSSYARNRNPYYEGPVRANFDGLRFRNPDRPVTKGFADFLRWQWEGGRATWPEHYPSPHAGAKPPERVAGLRVTHIGHASVLLQTAGVNILVDPVFSERASPVSFAGPRRVNPPGVAFDDLPPIDAVLVTHNHYDHLDGPTLAALWARHKARVVVPLGNDVIVRGHAPDIAVSAHDWGEEIVLSDAVRVRVEPSYHWSARSFTDRRMALWASFAITTPAGLVYHVGDAGYHDGAIFREAGARYGEIALAILPIGAFEPRWFMRDNHMNPEEAVAVMRELRARQALGHHWGTFQITNEEVERPVEALDTALKAAGIPQERFVPLRPGLSWDAAAGPAPPLARTPGQAG
jgi:L-ascorbate metabolism protein UlaG (beta-lactamase superfamily)